MEVFTLPVELLTFLGTYGFMMEWPLETAQSMMARLVVLASPTFINAETKNCVWLFMPKTHLRPDKRTSFCCAKQQPSSCKSNIASCIISRDILYFVYEKYWYVIVYDKYRHCIWMLFIHRNLAYKECPYAIAYITYGHCYKQHLYAMPIFVVYNNILYHYDLKFSHPSRLTLNWTSEAFHNVSRLAVNINV